MAKYRIKTVTFESGRKVYRAQARYWWLFIPVWMGLNSEGSPDYGRDFDTYKEAGVAIGLHSNGNYKKKKVDVEYF